MEVFGALARGREPDGGARRSRSTGAVRARTGGGLSSQINGAIIGELRPGMNRLARGARAAPDAVNQHIEIINRDAESRPRRRRIRLRGPVRPGPAAGRLLREAGQGVVQGLPLEFVLGAYDRSGNAAGAAAASARGQRAPARRLRRADALLRAGRDDEAVASLRRAWESTARASAARACRAHTYATAPSTRPLPSWTRRSPGASHEDAGANLRARRDAGGVGAVRQVARALRAGGSIPRVVIPRTQISTSGAAWRIRSKEAGWLGSGSLSGRPM